jgi:flagellin
MKIDAALDTVNELRGTLGAIQNRFESAIASVETSSENLTAARSRIQDADFAMETAKMTSSQVLQQAGISVLSQANSSQQNILKLLQ